MLWIVEQINSIKQNKIRMAYERLIGMKDSHKLDKKIGIAVDGYILIEITDTGALIGKNIRDNKFKYGLAALITAKEIQRRNQKNKLIKRISKLKL